MCSKQNAGPMPSGCCAGGECAANKKPVADGRHLPPSFLVAAARAKGFQNLVLTSDASPAAGLPDGTYPFGGGHVVVGERREVRDDLRHTRTHTRFTVHWASKALG